jgi:hypothetical protein
MQGKGCQLADASYGSFETNFGDSLPVKLASL